MNPYLTLRSLSSYSLHDVAYETGLSRNTIIKTEAGVFIDPPRALSEFYALHSNLSNEVSSVENLEALYHKYIKDERLSLRARLQNFYKLYTKCTWETFVREGIKAGSIYGVSKALHVPVSSLQLFVKGKHRAGKYRAVDDALRDVGVPDKWLLINDSEVEL